MWVKGHVTDIMSILMSFFLFSFKTTLPVCSFLLLLSLLNFDFTIFTFCYSIKVFGKHKLGSSTIGQIRKTLFNTEFLTVANTLVMFNLKTEMEVN